jgi:hypothetical protein
MLFERAVAGRGIIYVVVDLAFDLGPITVSIEKLM